MILNHMSLFPKDKEEEEQDAIDLENIDPEELKVRSKLSLGPGLVVNLITIMVYQNIT